MGNTKRNDKYRRQMWARKLKKPLAAARAAAWLRASVLGTSRALSVDAATTPRVGLKRFPQTRDPRVQNAAMLPAFLRYLRDNHYRVVHVVPAEPAAHLEDVPEHPKSPAEQKH
jgi:hypothetical protein